MNEHIVLLRSLLVSLTNAVLDPSDERSANDCRCNIEDVAAWHFADLITIWQELEDAVMLLEEAENVFKFEALIEGRLDSLDVLLFEEPF